MTTYGDTPTNVPYAQDTSTDPTYAEQTPTLLNSWANYSAPTFRAAKYMVDGNGFVRCEGLVAGGAAGSVIFTLPVGWRPSATENFPAVTAPGNPNYITVAANGDVIAGAGASSTWLSLQHVRFQRAAPGGMITSLGNWPRSLSLIDNESRMFIEPWTAITLASGWVHAGAPHVGPEYTRDRFGTTYMRGMLQMTAGNAGGVCDLPAAYILQQSATTRSVSRVACFPAGGGVNCGQLRVLATSNTLAVSQPSGNLTSATLVSLGGVSFSTP